jgi:hypothetical protein
MILRRPFIFNMWELYPPVLHLLLYLSPLVSCTWHTCISNSKAGLLFWRRRDRHTIKLISVLCQAIHVSTAYLKDVQQHWGSALLQNIPFNHDTSHKNRRISTSCLTSFSTFTILSRPLVCWSLELMMAASLSSSVWKCLMVHVHKLSARRFTVAKTYPWRLGSNSNSLFDIGDLRRCASLWCWLQMTSKCLLTVLSTWIFESEYRRQLAHGKCLDAIKNNLDLFG